MKTIEEIEQVLSQAFTLEVFYDSDRLYEIEPSDIRMMIYHTGCYKNMNDLTTKELEMFCDHVYEKKMENENDS